MTVGRGSGAVPIVILIVLAVGLLITVIVVGSRPDGSAPTASGAVTTTTEAEPARIDQEQSNAQDRASDALDDDASADDEAAIAPVEASEPVGTRLQGVRASRMERWAPLVSADGTMNTVAARSTVVDSPVRAVPLDASQGLDAVAARIAYRQWDELGAGATVDVPRIVWGAVERALDGAGELQWIHSVERGPHVEYILRFEDARLLLRLYGSRETVHDVEIEALPNP